MRVRAIAFSVRENARTMARMIRRVIAVAVTVLALLGAIRLGSLARHR